MIERGSGTGVPFPRFLLPQAMRIELNPASSTPLYKQIVEEIRKLIARGVLVPGDRIPTVRELAVQCRVNRNTAARAVQVLEAEGVVNTRVGKGTFISESLTASAATVRSTALVEAVERLVREVDALGIDTATVLAQVEQRLKRRKGPEGPPGRRREP